MNIDYTVYHGQKIQWKSTGTKNVWLSAFSKISILFLEDAYRFGMPLRWVNADKNIILGGLCKLI